MLIKNILLLFSYICNYNKLQKYKTTAPIFSSGFDERFIIFNHTNNSYKLTDKFVKITQNKKRELNKIKTNFRKKQLLDKLLDEKIPIYEKLQLINDNDNYNSIKQPNIRAGGLIKNDDDAFFLFNSKS